MRRVSCIILSAVFVVSMSAGIVGCGGSKAKANKSDMTPEKAEEFKELGKKLGLSKKG
jgi:hypothetical protein